MHPGEASEETAGSAGPTTPVTLLLVTGRRRTPLDLLRGVLIGLAEVVPGVSGGTIALVTGVYDTLILGAGHVVSAIRFGLTDLVRGHGSARAAAELRHVRWAVVLPVGLGMVTAVVLGARLLEPLLERHPEGARAVFFGLICASLIVPIRLVARHTGRSLTVRELLPGVVAAGAAFVLTGLPPGEISDPPLVLVGLAASLAVCALVLPGVSGSFLLLTLGLYERTLSAVNDRDWPYLAVFFTGAALGLATFVKLLQWLLERHYRTTLVVMTGLMAGSLRALWPWQDDDRTLLPPDDNAAFMLALAVTAAAGVLVVLWLESKLSPAEDQLPGAESDSDVAPGLGSVASRPPGSSGS